MTELAIQHVAREAEPAERCMVFLHGILGRGANWRTIAKRLVERRPGWSALLVDLRMHGDSQGMPEPHTLESAAADLDRLAARSAVRLEGVVGHSFGGKVALEWLRRRRDARDSPPLSECWVLDSAPGPRPGGSGSESVLAVVDTLETIRFPKESRRDFVSEVTGAGFSAPLAQWLATNLVRTDRGFEWGLDLAAIRALLDDYFERDLWPVVEAPGDRTALHLVVADRSDVWSAGDRERAQRAAGDRVVVHTLDAGHWLHVEAPDDLVALLSDPRADRGPGI